MTAQDVKAALRNLSDPARAPQIAKFFKTEPGGYGEGDKFIGMTVPQQQAIARQFLRLPLSEVIQLLHSEIHEDRHTALFILVYQYRRGDSLTKKEIAGIYYRNRAFVNNWDLVDGTAPQILGDYLLNRSPKILFALAKSSSLWDRRIAILATFAWIRIGQCDLTLAIAEQLLDDREDLIHKAVGWALREVGKKDEAPLIRFLDNHVATMSRTTLRYSIERLSPRQRKHYMSLKQARLTVQPKISTNKLDYREPRPG